MAGRNGGRPMILFVCEGNVCRSVLAERVLAAGLPEQAGVTVASAGTAALTGARADETTSEIASRLGISLQSHRARQLTPELLGQAQMVVAASRHIRSVAVQLYPRAVKYSFTIRQLARILQEGRTGFAPEGATGAELVTALSHSLNRAKGQLLGHRNEDDDVPDPRGRPYRVHEQTSELIVDAVAPLALALGGEPVAWVPARTGLRRTNVRAAG